VPGQASATAARAADIAAGSMPPSPSTQIWISMTSPSRPASISQSSGEMGLLYVSGPDAAGIAIPLS